MVGEDKSKDHEPVVSNHQSGDAGEDGVEKDRRSSSISSAHSLAVTATTVPAKSPLPKDYSYTITPMTVPGVLSTHNQDAIDWSANGFIAYGCQNVIVIVDTNCTSINYCQSKF